MISKKYGENEIRMMFLSFGQMEECRILRGPDGQSRGRCAFISSASIHSGPSLLPRLNPPKSSAIPFHPRRRYSRPPRLTAKGAAALAVRHNGSPWQPLAAGVFSWAQLAAGLARLLFNRLLHHTLQRPELAFCRISYIALRRLKSLG